MRIDVLVSALLGVAVATSAAAAQGRPTIPREEEPLPDSILRRAVKEHFPAALTGEMGRRPAVWIAADSNNRVLKVASGNAELAQGLTWHIAARKLPGVPMSAQPGDFMQWGKVVTNQDTVHVIWVRLSRGRLGP